MKIEDARRKGFDVKLITPAPVIIPEPVVLPPVPVEVTVHVENSGIADALKALEPTIVEVVQDQGVNQAFMVALERSSQAVVAAANKIPARAIVDSCELEHEWERGMPIIKSIKFSYREV